ASRSDPPHPTGLAGPKRLRIQEIGMSAKLTDALDLKFDSDAGDGLTIRGYLRELLLTLWSEEEGFSGKRPFGNSGWQSDLYAPLVRAGLISGSFDEDGWLDEYDREDGRKIVDQLIREALKDNPA
ncbi:MAG: hypothetical protein KGL35_04255, partial [Bradyrhizobium sp.]|nr:hypothetical protein [Bradyrhizobium sp.]